jgi:general secretion pathway protein K
VRVQIRDARGAWPDLVVALPMAGSFATQHGCAAMSRQRGAALLLVMWLVLLLSGLVASYAMSARIESCRATARRAAWSPARPRGPVEVRGVAPAGAGSRQRWVADGRALQVAVRRRRGDRSRSAMKPPRSTSMPRPRPCCPACSRNSASHASVPPGWPAPSSDWRDPDNLSQPVGGAEDPAYASAGLAWGAKDAPFDSVAELAQVLGMRPALVASAAPHLTVYSGNAAPNANIASPASCWRRWACSHARRRSTRMRRQQAPAAARIVSTAVPDSPMVAARICR